MMSGRALTGRSAGPSYTFMPSPACGRAPVRAAVVARPRTAARTDVVVSASPAAPPPPADPALARPGGRRVAVLKANKTASLAVVEGPRPLAEYMALPVSQYSVLDAQRIERLGDDTFRCYVDGFKFLTLRVEPVVDVAVTVGPRGPTVTLLGARLAGSPRAEAVNDRFSVTMTNAVRWEDGGGGPGGSAGRKITSAASIQLALDVPGWAGLLPVPALERAGGRVMQRVLDIMVPRFLAQLAADYGAWAEGRERRPAAGSLSLESEDDDEL